MIEEGATLHDEYIPAGTETAFDGWSRDAIQSILTADDLPEYYDKDELEGLFVDFRGHACKFRDCNHLEGIKGCGIYEAAQKGEILMSRYQSYNKMYKEILKK